MGYTHYLIIEKVRNNEKLAMKKTVKECLEVIKPFLQVGTNDNIFYQGIVTIEEQAENKLWINGIDELSHETLCIELKKGFSFCKTARKPYDIFVVACLAIMKDNLKDAIIISSDGDKEELDNGTLLASKMLGREIKNPLLK